MRPDTLEQLVEVAELEATIAMMAEDQAAGVAPPWATRPLYAHELVARTNFAAIDDAAERLTSQLADTLTHARARLLDLVADHVAAAADVADGYRRVLDLRTAGIETLAGAGDVIEATRSQAEDLLFAHAIDAGERARAEAVAQGVDVADVADPLDLATVERLDEQARRLAQGPPADLLRTVQDEVTLRRPSTTTPAELAGHIRNLGGTLSPAPIREAASTAAASVEGTARAGTADSIGTPAAVYASELLDRSTCAPCSMVDGHRYTDTTAARVDYPGGTFRNCAGGARCRGTLVFVWDTEAVPSVDDEPPAGPATLPPEGPPPAPAPPTSPPAPAAAPSPLDPAAPTAEELDVARRDVSRIRGQYRAHAHDVQEDARAFFDNSDTYRVQQPPPRTLRRRDPVTGRVTLERDSAANWDWFDALHPDEQKRLRRTWMSDRGSPISPDVLAAHLSRAFGIDDEGRAIQAWLEQTRRYDASGLVARGRLPVAESYGGADVNALIDSPYDLRRLFGADLEGAAVEVATVNAAEGEEIAARIFPSVRPGFDPPWAMTEQAWTAEVAELEARAETLTALDDEWAAYSVEDQATVDRLRELVPASLDDEDHPLPLPDLYRKIVAMARRARLIG